VTLVDTSFDTNPEQQRETLSNELDVDPAYLSGFCNFQQQLELYRKRLLISRFQVRVLGGSLSKVLQMKVMREPWPMTGALVQPLSSNVANVRR
jgi:hypothetical protein